LEIPKILNIGCGTHRLVDNALNTDINPKINPDAILDITKVPFGEKIHTKTFGEIEIKEEMFDEIHASHVLEHIPDLVSAMWNCYKLLKWGGKMEIAVPYDLSYGAWQDPTHVRAFNEHSWKYWCLTWCKEQFGWEEGFSMKKNSIDFTLNRPMPIELALRTPRVIEEMSVTLYKIKNS
jgi:SAM-dependent methyltransferase